MILKTYDNLVIDVTEDQAEKIANGINNGAKFIKIFSKKDGKNYYIGSANIRSILPEKEDYVRLGAPEHEEISEEQRKKNLERLAKLRKEFGRIGEVSQ